MLKQLRALNMYQKLHGNGKPAIKDGIFQLVRKKQRDIYFALLVLMHREKILRTDKTKTRSPVSSSNSFRTNNNKRYFWSRKKKWEKKETKTKKKRKYKKTISQL